MKVTTPDLVKFKKLQRRLAEPMRSVVGILELLWRATALQAPRGDIGKFDNEDIAVLCDWDGDPDQLIEALVASGWLDRCSIHRLVVHDWAEHAPTFVRGVLAKKKLDFVKGDAVPPATKDASSGQEQSTIDASIDATKDGSKDASSGQEQSTTMSCLVLPCHVMPSDGAPTPKKERKSFKPPTLEEVVAYVAEKKLRMNPETFMYHYEATGWKTVSGGSIKDWKAAAHKWASKEYGSTTPQNNEDELVKLRKQQDRDVKVYR